MSLERTSSTMLNRRHVLGLGAVLAVGGRVVSARADVSTDQVTVFMQQAIKDLSGIVNASTPESEKAAGLQKLIDKVVDVDGIGRFCLGRFWRVATPDEQKQYIALFHKVLLKNITGKVADYSGVDISIQKTLQRDDGVVVSTMVVRPNNAPAKVDWLLNTAGSSPLVIDVIAEGTSLRLTQRNDYTAFLAKNNNSVSALIDALKNQANG